MIAFVLSGGGPRGALQAGALQVLLEKGIRPDILVGTSAGAVNAAYLAADPTPAAAYRLGDVWRRLTKEQLFGGGVLQAAWHLLTHRDSLYCNDRLRSYFETHSPTRERFFRGLAVRLYIVATDLLTRRPYVFGEDRDEPLLDALMASSATCLAALELSRASVRGWRRFRQPAGGRGHRERRDRDLCPGNKG